LAEHPDSQDLASRIALMRDVAARAGQLALDAFERQSFAVHGKPDGSPLTDADLACERLIRDAIGDAFPHDAVIGEEFGSEAGTTGYRWIVDPIDGTVSFASGVPLFGTLIAIESLAGNAPEVIAGVCEMPALRERVWGARGQGAWWERAGREPVGARVRGPLPLRDALVVTTGWEYFHRARCPAALELLAQRAGRLRGWTDCYGMMLAVTGRCDAAVEPMMMPWDAGPFGLLMREAGGTYSDWTGEPSLWSGAPGMRWRTAVAAHPSLHAELVALLAPHEPQP
jgi:histidinol phosphatase-like enzyme (inositol monophosphatase family)